MPRILPFEEHREEYEQWFVLNRFAYQSELDAVRQLLPEGKGLEIGVGSGLFAAPLGIEFGVEPSPKMLELAKQRGIKVIRGIGEQLPVRNASLDFALMVTTVCFLDNVMQGFREAQRILKPGGHFLVGFIEIKLILQIIKLIILTESVKKFPKRMLLQRNIIIIFQWLECRHRFH